MKKENKGISLIVLVITIIVVIILAGAVILDLAENNTKIGQEVIKQEITNDCNHEFVITSKYDWLLGAYKTISKCIKCGMEI